MKHKTKTKNLEDSTQDASCRAVSHKRDRPQPTEGVRRSTRKRSAPKTFVVTSKKSKALYWEAAEKEKLLKVLQELNTQQLGTALYYSKNRYPIKLMSKRIGSKSMDAVKKYLTLLERRGAGMALSQMKHQAPLQSWRQMADKLTALTSDNCSRQLIRVCSILALESKDEDESAVEEHGGDETQTIPTLSLTPATTTSAASNSTGSNHTNDVHVSKEIASPDASVSAREIAMTTSNVETVSGSGMSTAASNVATAAAEAKDSSATDSVSSTATSQNISSTSPTRDISSVTTATTAATTDSTSTSATATSTAAARDSSSTTTATRDGISTATRGNSTTAIRDHFSASASKPNESIELELKPDYPSIYKYFANLMQGEQKELGPLESLVVLDCLTSVEKHLVARDNTKQKKFAQKRFLDILENLYLSIDGETARTAKGGTMNEDTDAGNVLTMADLLGINNQSQSWKCQADQSKATLPENSQSASNYSVSQSTSTMLQGQSSTANKRSSREIPTRLGSLNPFGVPVKLLEIRQDR
ncbi:pneumococcal serine-rich repeat protein-like [Patiria miniata]|uniref:Uncharacterized protein n=1 Tax=Patiria miniata TaxID=46514 RepID=A0A914APQ2_PATMI|nr:pneumococcal serine-rich repeat protein-like [Patiria miniata]XP_038065733.1 pneumococcal serine-rich repeat protein-like [Patiria miniata]